MPPACWDAVNRFLGVQTQWRIGGMGGASGLDYTAVEAFLRATGVKDRKEAFYDIQLMELAALEIMNRSRRDGDKSS